MKNASGDSFCIYRSDDGHWVARQMTGRERNYMGIPATLTADTKAALTKQLRSHHSQ